MAKRLGFALRRSGVPALLLAGMCCGGDPELPPAPAFDQQNEASVALFRGAEARVRQERFTAESIGELGMLYHAYRFLDPARRCYELAREAAPGSFRFVFYEALAEKTAFRYDASESLFEQALALRPDDPEVLAELGELYLMWSRADDAGRLLARAVELEPTQPKAAVGLARLAMIRQDFRGVIDRLEPVVTRYPRLSGAHKLLAAAYDALGEEDRRRFHQEAGEYGAAVESDRVKELHELAVDAIVEGGDPSAGPLLIQTKCARCHDHARIYDRNESRRFWARTVRRMQREAGWQFLSDDEASAVVAYLSTRDAASR